MLKLRLNRFHHLSLLFYEKLYAITSYSLFFYQFWLCWEWFNIIQIPLTRCVILMILEHFRVWIYIELINLGISVISKCCRNFLFNDKILRLCGRVLEATIYLFKHTKWFGYWILSLYSCKKVSMALCFVYCYKPLSSFSYIPF